VVKVTGATATNRIPAGWGVGLLAGGYGSSRIHGCGCGRTVKIR